MSVLIKGMKMPGECNECDMYVDTAYSPGCLIGSNGIPNRYNYDPKKRPDWCPLVEIDGDKCDWFLRDPTPEERKSVYDYIQSISENTGVTWNIYGWGFCDEKEVQMHCESRCVSEVEGKRSGNGGRRMSDLKPCPFCGGDAEMEIKYGDYGYSPDIYSVKCKRCNAKIGKVSNNYADLSDDVVNAWNRRVKDD